MKPRNQALDILRGVAILLVVLYHFSRIRVFFNFGWTGVDLFFVLSGYLISGLLFDEYKRAGTLQVKRFWIRRGFKIYPSFYVMMALTGAALFAAHNTHPGLLNECLFIQNYGAHIWDHTWSLAVEEHFYLLLPILLLVLLKFSSSRSDPFAAVPWIFAFLFFACLGLRIAAHAYGMNWVAIHAETQFRIDSLFAGVFLGYLKHFRARAFAWLTQKPLWAVAVPFLVPALMVPAYNAFINVYGPTLLYIGYSCIFLSVVERPASNGPLARAMSYIGKHSYSIYLWHGVTWPLLFKGRFDFRFLLMGLAVSIPSGILLSKAIEIPALALRDRIFPALTHNRLHKLPQGEGQFRGDAIDKSKASRQHSFSGVSSGTRRSSENRREGPFLPADCGEHKQGEMSAGLWPLESRKTARESS